MKAYILQDHANNVTNFIKVSEWHITSTNYCIFVTDCINKMELHRYVTLGSIVAHEISLHIMWEIYSQTSLNVCYN